MSAVIVDTNILVRAFLSGKQTDDKILRLIISGNYQLIYGQNQMEEFTRVLGYRRITKKYHIDELAVGEFLNWIIGNGRELEPQTIKICRDPDDNYIIGLALKAAKIQQVYLITGDKDILALKGKILKVEILTAGKFVASIKN